MATKKEKLLKKLELQDAVNLPALSSPNFPRYIIKSLDRFEDQDWDVMKSVYNRAVLNGDIVKI